MRRVLSILSLVLLFGCSNETVDKERLTIHEDESSVAYVESENLLAPRVCLENQQKTQSVDPYLITFELTDDLKTIVDKTSNVSLDSRNLFNNDGDSNSPRKEKSFCVGTNLPLKEEVNQDKLDNLITEGNIKVSVTELNGDVIFTYTLQKFVIGKPDGSVVSP
ncbi:hypothetical protein BN1058_02600 [Paraliobacillus sp. PM-2]|uniref:hypothetical protein n=1 Tax=Paraliobacillus sp. PM-2 TaxID=1462524 RepID=UPI00061C54B4|nr:hypothetical protein [Paraliobacillus sp. PM-2]CQR48246.1 hypothetical protein BN1058_02600 [Paraliobacillus sp. PM-2]